MLKKIFFLLLVLKTADVVSQSSYQTLDSISFILSKFQKSNEGKTFTGADGSQYELSFSENNFYVLSHNRLAGYAEYRKYKDKEVLCITENIDLSKATSLEAMNSNGQSIQLVFPAGHLKTLVYEKGKLVETLSPDHLDFYLLSYESIYPEIIYGERFKTVAALCHLMQVEKGMIDEAYVKKLNTHFEQVKSETTGWNLKVYEGFLEAYKNAVQKPLYYNEVALSYKPLKQIIDKLNRFADSLSTLYRFKPNLSRTEFLSHCNDARTAKLKSIYSANAFAFPTTSYYRDINYRKTKNIYVKGFTGYITNNNDKVISCSWYLEDEKLSFAQHKEVFEKIRQDIMDKAGPYAYIPEKKDNNGQIEQIVVQVPEPGTGDVAYFITFKLINVNSFHNIYINYSTDRTLAEW